MEKCGIGAKDFIRKDEQRYQYDFPFCCVSGSSYRFGFSTGVTLSVICDLACRITGDS